MVMIMMGRMVHEFSQREMKILLLLMLMMKLLVRMLLMQWKRMLRKMMIMTTIMMTTIMMMMMMMMMMTAMVMVIHPLQSLSPLSLPPRPLPHPLPLHGHTWLTSHSLSDIPLPVSQKNWFSLLTRLNPSTETDWLTHIT